MYARRRFKSEDGGNSEMKFPRGPFRARRAHDPSARGEDASRQRHQSPKLVVAASTVRLGGARVGPTESCMHCPAHSLRGARGAIAALRVTLSGPRNTGYSMVAKPSVQSRTLLAAGQSRSFPPY